MAKKAGETKSYRKYVIRFWVIFSAMVLSVFFLFFSISKGWLGFMPSFEELENPQSNLASEIISADQEVLGSYFIENRIPTSIFRTFTQPYQCPVATEDIRFTRHSGIDVRAFAAWPMGL
jgi:penicillin-binding protein 1A